MDLGGQPKRGLILFSTTPANGTDGQESRGLGVVLYLGLVLSVAGVWSTVWILLQLPSGSEKHLKGIGADERNNHWSDQC